MFGISSSFIPDRRTTSSAVLLIGIGTSVSLVYLGRRKMKLIGPVIGLGSMLKDIVGTHLLRLSSSSEEEEEEERKKEEYNEEEKKRRLELELRKPRKTWNTVIFFPDPYPLLDHEESSTNRLISYFEAARVSIQLCVYLTSHPALINVVSKKFKEGLMVQAVTDYDTATAHANFAQRIWQKKGIEVRMKNTGFLMHNKFAIIDGEAAITGSLNWTKQGFAYNQENVLITTNKNIVDKYLEEFYNLWNLFRPSVQ